MSNDLNERGFPANWTEDYHQRIKNEELVATWRHEDGTPEEQAQAVRRLAERREELGEQYGPTTGTDKGEDNE